MFLTLCVPRLEEVGTFCCCCAQEELAVLKSFVSTTTFRDPSFRAESKNAIHSFVCSLPSSPIDTKVRSSVSQIFGTRSLGSDTHEKNSIGSFDSLTGVTPGVPVFVTHIVVDFDGWYV